MKEDDVEFDTKFKQTKIHPILKKHFGRDEFIGRIDEIVYFTPLSAAQLGDIIHKELIKWADIARQKHCVDLLWNAEVEKRLAQNYNPHYGVRSLQHEVNRKVISKLAQADTEGRLSVGAQVHVQWSPQLRDFELRVQKSGNPASIVSALPTRKIL
eukprot:NODE_7367_length_594_cov_40.897216_g7344_i0.p1 GENE.NODE_7367_length_594_cov_40.897216_g7344_i0~~NODE_7367_length_594_cov_40.897216_g7344_i0.p1  ORF type:complete len:178 (-),score=50.38 NODE_7367_length_594_cov_40.897216_g7344_i0:59-526(-)